MYMQCICTGLCTLTYLHLNIITSSSSTCIVHTYTCVHENIHASTSLQIESEERRRGGPPRASWTSRGSSCTRRPAPPLRPRKRTARPGCASWSATRGSIDGVGREKKVIIPVECLISLSFSPTKVKTPFQGPCPLRPPTGHSPKSTPLARFHTSMRAHLQAHACNCTRFTNTYVST